MTATDALNKIKFLIFGEEKVDEVQLAEATLADGETRVTIEGEFLDAVGKILYVITEDGNVPAPEGTHSLADLNLNVTVDAEGVVTAVDEVATEEPVENEEQFSNENETAFSDELIGAIAELIKPLNEKINTIESKFNSLDGDFKKFRKEPADEVKKISNNFSAEKVDQDARLEALASLRKK